MTNTPMAHDLLSLALDEIDDLRARLAAAEVMRDRYRAQRDTMWAEFALRNEAETYIHSDHPTLIARMLRLEVKAGPAAGYMRCDDAAWEAERIRDEAVDHRLASVIELKGALGLTMLEADEPGMWARLLDEVRHLSGHTTTTNLRGENDDGSEFPAKGLTKRALAAGGYWVTGQCEFDHPHPDHPCGAKGNGLCVFCDAIGDCACWEPATRADVDSLICEALEPRGYSNHVRMGDGTYARLVPAGCLNRITEPGGRQSCNHGDMVCSQADRPHDTITLYEVQPITADEYHPTPTNGDPTMTKYRQKPVVIEAEQWDGTAEGATPIIDWVLDGGGTARYWAAFEPVGPAAIAIDTLERTMEARAGDWIIRGVQGEFYPCKPDIFAATYEPVEP